MDISIVISGHKNGADFKREIRDHLRLRDFNEESRISLQINSNNSNQTIPGLSPTLLQNFPNKCPNKYTKNHGTPGTNI